MPTRAARPANGSVSAVKRSGANLRALTCPLFAFRAAIEIMVIFACFCADLSFRPESEIFAQKIPKIAKEVTLI